MCVCVRALREFFSLQSNRFDMTATLRYYSVFTRMCSCISLKHAVKHSQQSHYQYQWTVNAHKLQIKKYEQMHDIKSASSWSIYAYHTVLRNLNNLPTIFVFCCCCCFGSLSPSQYIWCYILKKMRNGTYKNTFNVKWVKTSWER